MTTGLQALIDAVLASQDMVTSLAERGPRQGYRIGRAKQARDMAVADLTERVEALAGAAKEGRRIVRYYNDPEEQWVKEGWVMATMANEAEAPAVLQTLLDLADHIAEHQRATQNLLDTLLGVEDEAQHVPASDATIDRLRDALDRAGCDAARIRARVERIERAVGGNP